MYVLLMNTKSGIQYLFYGDKTSYKLHSVIQLKQSFYLQVCESV